MNKQLSRKDQAPRSFGSRLPDPASDIAASALIDIKKTSVCDLAVLGSGPAGLSAAIFAARAGLETIVFEKSVFGGALNEIPRVENYPGFLGSGAELAKNMVKNAQNAGAKLKFGTCSKILPPKDLSPLSAHASAADHNSGVALPEKPGLAAPNFSEPGQAVYPEDQSAYLFTSIIDGEPVYSRAVLIATGSEAKTLPFDLKIPTSTCVLCDAPLAKGKHVVVVGGGNSAVSGALYLARIANDVTLISHSSIKATQNLKKTLKSQQNVQIRENLEPTPEILGRFDFCFVLIGQKPATAFLPPEILNPAGEIVTDANCMTKIPGLFSSGIVSDQTHPHQILFAAASGAAAALKIVDYLQA